MRDIVTACNIFYVVVGLQWSLTML